ncbi:TPA: hypothetical protein ACX6QL_000518 [Photobacterium damselae]
MFKGKGTIVFLGSMNSMPMMYALELKKIGYDILYFVDSDRDNYLCRPEYHYPEIKFPYQDWIVEFPLKSQIFLPIFKKYYSNKIIRIVNKKSKSKVIGYVLNGFFIALSDMFDGKKFALIHGSDLSQWGNMNNNNKLYDLFTERSFFKFLPKVLSRKIIVNIVHHQFNGFCNCNYLITFFNGLNKELDAIVNKIRKEVDDVYERMDISFSPLVNQPRGVSKIKDKMIILSAVRFSYQTFSSSSEGRSKGNDIIIEGLSLFSKINKNIEIHFIEKGEDVNNAKILCEKLGLNDYVIWHKEMPLSELISLYNKSHVCFDQVGDHWVSAIGAYALWLGKPLIANDSNFVESKNWPKDNPILSSSSAQDVYESLIYLQNNNKLQQISKESMVFAECYLSPDKIVRKITKSLEES